MYFVLFVELEEIISPRPPTTLIIITEKKCVVSEGKLTFYI
jgi:hypothetical protein